MEALNLDSNSDGGTALAARFYPCDGAAIKGAVLIGGAMGVRQDYYAPFAQWLAAQGFAVMTFDYRGMGDSRAPAQARSLRGWDAARFAWARAYDSAIDALRERAPARPLYLFGHSMGAQLPGMLRNRASTLSRSLDPTDPLSGHFVTPVGHD